MKSAFLSLNVKDFLKGLLLAFLTALFTGVYQLLQAGPFVFDWATFQPIVLAAASAAFAYFLKNFFTNSDDQVLTPEK